MGIAVKSVVLSIVIHVLADLIPYMLWMLLCFIPISSHYVNCRTPLSFRDYAMDLISMWVSKDLQLESPGMWCLGLRANL